MTVGEEVVKEAKIVMTRKAEAYKALANAQAEFKPVKMNKSASIPFKNKETGQFSYKEYKYGDLAAILEATRPALNKHGISFSHECGITYDDGCYVSATPVLRFSNGYEMRDGTVTMRPANVNPHAIGSVMTYAKRYSLTAKLGIAAEEDDDGHGAMPSSDEEKTSNRKPKTPSKGRPATAPREQSSSNEKIEQFVNGKLNPKYQTANGLLSIQKVKKLIGAVEEKNIDKHKFMQFLNQGIYKETPVQKPYDIRQSDFDAIMMIVDQWEALEKKIDNSPEDQSAVNLINLDQEAAIKDKVKEFDIDRKQFMVWLHDFAVAKGDADVKKVCDVHADWYHEIMQKLDDPIDIMAHGK